MFHSKDVYFMERALQISAIAKGATSPNPMVGCVIVKNGEIIAEGYHKRAGGLHAEIIALEKAGSEAKDSDMYITLEPCTHYGKTPPCIQAIIQVRPRRVIIAMIDPNPIVSGKGIQALKNAGITVDVGVLEDRAKRLNEVFIKYITTGIPFVIAKWAMTLDGKIATISGASKYISSIQTLQWVHTLRNEVDAILVGGNTVLLDNPNLTIRLVPAKEKKPIRVVLDTQQGFVEDLNIFKETDLYPTWIISGYNRNYSKATRIIRLPLEKKSQIPLYTLMKVLGDEGITSVLIEGGSKTFTSAFEEGVVDKIYCLISPKIFGGLNALTPIAGSGIAKQISESIALNITSVNYLEQDVIIEAYVVK